MINIVRSNSDNKDFQQLANALELELKIRDGEEHEFYADLNKVDKLEYVIIGYDNDEAVGCGALRAYEDVMEIKRMFVVPTCRGKGTAKIILQELENWSRQLGCKRCVLETGKNQPEAIKFYEKNGYRVIDNFGKYEGSENSVCFEKEI